MTIRTSHKAETSKTYIDKFTYVQIYYTNTIFPPQYSNNDLAYIDKIRMALYTKVISENIRIDITVNDNSKSYYNKAIKWIEDNVKQLNEGCNYSINKEKYTIKNIQGLDLLLHESGECAQCMADLSKENKKLYSLHKKLGLI